MLFGVVGGVRKTRVFWTAGYKVTEACERTELVISVESGMHQEGELRLQIAGCIPVCFVTSVILTHPDQDHVKAEPKKTDLA